MREYLTVNDVAQDLGVSPDTVRYWTRTGSLKAARTRSGVRLIDPNEVHRMRKLRDSRKPRGCTP